MTLFVRTYHSATDTFTSYWSAGEHAWGSLESATVYTEREVQSFHTIPNRYDASAPITGYSGFVRYENGNVGYVPVEGEWTKLPHMLKLKTLDEHLAEQSSEQSYG